MTTQKTERDALIEAVEESAYDWTRYVEADSAPHTLSIHLAPSIAAVKAAMDAQALRIGELEKNAEADAFLIALANDNAARLLVECDTLRAELAAIRTPVTWGIDWGKQGDLTAVSIVKKYSDDSIEVIATEYEPIKRNAPVADVNAMGGQEVAVWYAGEPPFPQNQEWFIAQTIYGDKVVLQALPKEFSYDYKTADETYMLAKNIKRWMQFPDCEFLPPEDTTTPPVNAVLVEALKLAVRQNSHDMVMTGEELRKCESALSQAAQQKGGE
jgi:hypothetical protein